MNDALGGVQTVLVLGGTSELAVASLRALDLRPGATVVLAGRSVQSLTAAAAGLSARIVPVEWDARATGGHDAFVEKVVADVGDIDLVLAAAGILGDQTKAEDDTAHAVDVLETNFVGVAAALLPVARQLRKQGHGVLVVFSSVAGLRARKANFVYGASKAGLDAFAEGLGSSLIGSGARVVTVRPGFVRGRMTEGMEAAPFATTPDAVGAAVAKAVRSHAEVVYVPGPVGPIFGVLRVLPRRVFRKLQG